jgi:hypothetical protein
VYFLLPVGRRAAGEREVQAVEQAEVQAWERVVHPWVRVRQAESVPETRALLGPLTLAPTRTGRTPWAQQALVRIRRTAETHTNRQEPQACHHRALQSILEIPVRGAVAQAVPLVIPEKHDYDALGTGFGSGHGLTL